LDQSYEICGVGQITIMQEKSDIVLMQIPK
jgi:hypothetical protein